MLFELMEKQTKKKNMYIIQCIMLCFFDSIHFSHTFDCLFLFDLFLWNIQFQPKFIQTDSLSHVFDSTSECELLELFFSLSQHVPNMPIIDVQGEHLSYHLPWRKTKQKYFLINKTEFLVPKPCPDCWHRPWPPTPPPRVR